MSDDNKVTVRIPRELADRVARDSGKRFDSLDDSVTFLLERALRSKAEVPTGQAEFSSDEKKAIEDRLKSLGYL